MTGTALALSPHLDDAAFSCGGTLATLARGGWRVVMATLFTRSVPDPQGFALACQLDKGLGPEVDYMALRRAEDVAAARALGIEAPRHLALPEAPHRGYRSAAALFAGVLPTDDVAGPLREAVAALVAEVRPDVILAPQAIGGHVDHVQLVNAVGCLHGPVLWWSDFPYAVRDPCPAAPFADRFAAVPLRRVTLDPAARDAKLAACLAYASQLGFQFGGAEALRAGLSSDGATETFRGQVAPPFSG